VVVLENPIEAASGIRSAAVSRCEEAAVVRPRGEHCRSLKEHVVETSIASRRVEIHRRIYCTRHMNNKQILS
jgi:hypothetical protein